MDGKAGGNGRADQAGPAAVETCGGGWQVADLGRLGAETSAKGDLSSADVFVTKPQEAVQWYMQERQPRIV